MVCGCERQINNILTEREILIDNNCQFLVNLHWAFQNTRHLYFVLDYCPGGELYRLIAKCKKLNEPHVRFYAA